MHTDGHERIIWRSMLVTTKTSELFGQFPMNARLVEEAIRICTKRRTRKRTSKRSRPTLVMRGEKTRALFALTSEAITKCVPGAQQVILQNVNHDGPCRDPAAFTAAVFEFLSGLE